MSRSLVCLALLVPLFGCSEGGADCRWPTEDSGRLDLRDRAAAEHLVEDVRIAEDLAIRFGDARWAPGPVRAQGRHEQCLAPTLSQIASRHDVPLGTVLAARESLSDRGVDPAVNVPVGLFSVFLGLFVVRRLTRRFAYKEELLANVVASVLASAMVGVVTLAFGRLWEGGVEIIRLGNDHLSYRGLRLQWTQHPLELLAAGVAVFWVVWLACYWMAEGRQSGAKASGHAV